MNLGLAVLEKRVSLFLFPQLCLELSAVGKGRGMLIGGGEVGRQTSSPTVWNALKLPSLSTIDSRHLWKPLARFWALTWKTTHGAIARYTQIHTHIGNYSCKLVYTDIGRHRVRFNIGDYRCRLIFIYASKGWNLDLHTHTDRQL